MNDFFKSWRSELVKSGTYSPVAFGMTQKKLKEIFGDESGYSTFCCKNGSPCILKYDDIEFHFTDDVLPKLFLIYSDENYDIAIHKYKCSCCGYLTLATRGEYDICPVCFWEDDPYYFENDAEKILDIPLGANNDLTLREGRKNYKLFGASNKNMLKYVRKPRKEEYPYTCNASKK